MVEMVTLRILECFNWGAETGWSGYGYIEESGLF